MYDTHLIKSRISCVDVAKRCGLPIQRSGDRCVSPLRPGASNPSSFAVDTDFWFDFGDARGGDCIDLLAELEYSGDRGAAIRELARITGVESDGHDTQDWLDYTNQLNAKTAFYHSQLTEDDRKYLHSRGLSDADIDRLMIGRVTDGPLTGRLFLPYFHPNGYICYYATRALPGSAFPENKYMKQRRDEHSQHIPWGMQTLDRKSDTLVIAEGYFDAVSFEIQGYPVLSAITGVFSKSQIPTVIAAARKFKRVLIVYDNDAVTHAGQRFTERAAELLTRNRIPFVVGTVPTPYHDISEYYAAGGDLSRITDSAEDGLTYITGTFREFSDLEKFLYAISRYTKRTALDELFTRLKHSGRWNEKSLASLYKSCTSAPPENIVADEILRDHQILYVHAVGFYEYAHGVWNRLNDNIISGYADRAYGEFSTANRVSAITKLLKTRALRDVIFDRQPVWNFINGTLELDTGKFREHNPNDFCSIQASYPYNPNATYHAWEKFIDDVTAGDPKSAELLQLIPGYVFMQDCRYEKAFVLSGNGSNGKSKYLEILRMLFAPAVSHLSPRAMLDKFRLIQFRDAILNIAGEIRSDFRDTEETIKSLISGEPQSACFKSQDFVTFIPRTKLIFATNSEITSGDTSEGMARRLIIVNFKVSFVDYPEPGNPYQRQKNVDIMDELTEELSSGGIFNWAYAGYKLLQTVGYFTETNDQEELIRDFKRSSNPILVFFEEFYEDDPPQEILYEQAYSDYLIWCGNTGERSETSHKFHRELKKIVSNRYETGIRSVRVDGKPRKQRFYRLRAT